MVSKEDLNVRLATFDDGDDDDEEIYGGSEFSLSVELLLDLVLVDLAVPAVLD